MLLYASADQCRNDYRPDAGYRYPFAVYFLRRIFDAVLHGDALYLPRPGQAGKKVFLIFLVFLQSRPAS